MELCTISQLTTTSVNKVLEARVYRKWVAGQPPDMTPYAYCCIFLDREGHAIQANMELKEKDYFSAKLDLGMAYQIKNFACEATSDYQRTLETGVTLAFGKYTDFEKIPETTFPPHFFRFTSYNQLESKIPALDNNNKMHYPILTDYIGCLRSNGGMSSFGDANRRQGSKRKVEIENLNGNIVEFTMWDEMADHFGTADLPNMQQPVIIAVSSCRVSKYKDIYQLVATSATYYYLNPNIREAHEAREMYKARYEQAPPLIVRKVPYQDAMQEKLRNRFPLKTVMELNANSYKGTRFTAEATITDINKNKEWYFMTCHQCSKPAVVNGDNYFCLNHGPQAGPFFRYKFKGYITDGITTAPITFFTPVADKVVEHPCSELVEKYKPANPKNIPDEIMAIRGKSGIFQFRLNSFGNFKDLTLDAIYDIQTAAITTVGNTATGTKSSTSTISAVPLKATEETISSAPMKATEETINVEEQSSTSAGTPPPTDNLTTVQGKKAQDSGSKPMKQAKRILFEDEASGAKKPKND